MRRDLLLVGYGRFGKVLGSVLSADFNVCVLERRRVRISRPLRRTTPAHIGDFPVVVLALPLHRLEAFLRREGQRIRPGSFVADVSALKEAPMRWMNRYLPSSVYYSGLHPLFGPDSIGEGLPGHSVVVCRGRTTKSCHMKVVRYLKTLSLKVIETDPLTHDKTIASTLLLTQWIGRVIPEDLTIADPPFETPSMQHLRSICTSAIRDQPHIFRDLCKFSPYSRTMLKRLTGRHAGLFTGSGWKTPPDGD